jgi:hypothetical protein
MSFYEMRPFEPGRPFDLDEDGNPVTEEVVDTFEEGWPALEVASQLWGLLDDPRQKATKALGERLDVAAQREERPIRFKAADLDEAIGLLSGLEDALVGKVIDQDWTFAIDRLEEIRRRAPSLDLSPSRPDGDIIHAVGEGLWLTIALSNFLKQARANGSEVMSG